MKKHIFKILILSALLVLYTYTLCSCTGQVFQNSENTDFTQSTIPPQSTYETSADTQPKQEPLIIGGVEFGGGETEVDLADMPEDSLALAGELLTKLPLIETLYTGELSLSGEEYLSLCALNKNTSIISKISFEGKELDLYQTEIDISEHKVKDKEALSDIFSAVKKNIKFVMCDCGYTNEEMQTLRDSFPTLEFAWRIYMGKWDLRTDDEAFSVMIYNYNYTRMTSEDIEVLKYCTNMYALDLGHQAITDLSVMENLPELRVLILADNKVSDLSPLSKCQKLEYLELFVNRIQDISPLAECKNLVDLNIGWNRGLSDISAVYSLKKIERLWLPTTAAATQKKSEIEKNFPDAQIVFSDVDSVSSGWRTHPRYYVMRGMFTNNKYPLDFVG